MIPGWMAFLLILCMCLAVWALVTLARRLRLRSGLGAVEGQVVVITGASRGIGRSLALAFAQRGASLVLAARSEADLRATAQACEAVNPRVETLIVPTDVTDGKQLRALARAAKEHFGHIDILVNNAGIREGGAFTEIDPLILRKLIEVNLLAAMTLTQQILPDMIRQGKGQIVNMASAAGRVAEPYFVLYGSSKHGLIGFGDGLRRELAGTGVRVLTVSPGFINTDMVSDIGPVYRRMGFPMNPPEYVARRTLEGIVLECREIKIGWLETLAGYVNALAPKVIDLYWRVLMPQDFPEAAARQRTES